MTVALTLLASLCMVIAPPVANAAESVPPLQWLPVNVGRYVQKVVTSPNGDVTLPCTYLGSGTDLQTYNAAGQLVRDISPTTTVDGVPDCLATPVVDKNGAVYDIPFGKVGSGWSHGPNLLAYNGNTLKWKYPLSCTNDQPAQYAVGVNGDVYATTWESDGIHLIGLTPDVAPGQSVPSKLLDVYLDSDCSDQLLPYKDGVVVRGQHSGVNYYGYGGKKLASSVPSGDFWGLKVNTEGRVFTQNNSGQHRTIAVYDPIVGHVLWAYALIDNTDLRGIYPTSDGGVVAVIAEPVTNGGGIPVGKVNKLIKLDAYGNKSWENMLATTDAQGNSYGDPYVLPDGNNKLVVVRPVDEKTAISYPTTVPAIFIEERDATSGASINSTLMTGNLQQAGGPYGYYLNATPSIAGNTVELIAHCSSNCGNNTSDKLYAVSTSGVGMDYPRGVVLQASEPVEPTTWKHYVALGDSYSSGQGVGYYDDGTAIPGTNTCYRSVGAYSRVFTRNPYVPVQLDSFVACGGATTAIITGRWSGGINQSESPQDAALSSTTNIVTLTIGGNDIGFADFVQGCAIADCDAAHQTAMGKIDLLVPALNSTYKDILTKASKADVYVIGYPPLLSTNTSVCASVVPFNTAHNRDLGLDVLSNLNGTIKTAVDSLHASNPRIHYIDPAAANSPFIGHEICSGTPYFNNLDGGQPQNSFHPNQAGQIAFAQLVASQLTF